MNTILEIRAVKSELNPTVSEGSSLCLPWRANEGKGWSLRLRADKRRVPGTIEIPFYNPGTVGSSHLPDLAERKIASMTAMFRTVPSNGTGNSVPSRMLRENRSP